MKKVVLQVSQTIWDIALTHCGSIDAVFAIASLNSLSLTETIVAGTELIVPAVINEDVVKYYHINSIIPATGG